MSWCELFRYDPETGRLYERYYRRGGAKVLRERHDGREAGSTDGQGYRSIEIKGRCHKAHRIVWEMHHGPIPSGMEIDHINRDRGDNRIENLRLATHQEQCRNRAVVRDSGLRGTRKPKRGRWVARYGLNGKVIQIGSYDTEEEAHQAYLARVSDVFGEFATAASSLRAERNNSGGDAA